MHHPTRRKIIGSKVPHFLCNNGECFQSNDSLELCGPLSDEGRRV